MYDANSIAERYGLAPGDTFAQLLSQAAQHGPLPDASVIGALDRAQYQNAHNPTGPSGAGTSRGWFITPQGVQGPGASLDLSTPRGDERADEAAAERAQDEVYRARRLVPGANLFGLSTSVPNRDPFTTHGVPQMRYTDLWRAGSV